jgi:hypothetical protein
MGRISKALHRDFLALMSTVWPQPSAVESWLKGRRWKKTGRYGDMKKGREVPQEFIHRFVLYMLEEGKNDPAVFKAFNAYVRSKANRDVTKLSAAEICSLLFATELDILAQDSGTVVDRIMKMFGRGIAYVGCNGPEDVHKAIRWHYISFGRQLDGGIPPLEKRAAILRSQNRMDIPLEEYFEKAREWQTFDPWTVLLPWGKGSPTGMSIVLPLKKAVFDEIRSGHRMTYDVTPDDLVRPSPYLLLECCAERPPDEGGIDGNVSLQLKIAISTQVAKLSNFLKVHTLDPLTLLSFAASPVVRNRLEGNGFTPLGNFMPNTPVEMYERVVGLQNASDLGLRTLLWVLSHFSDDTLPPRQRNSSREPYDRE